MLRSCLPSSRQTRESRPNNCHMAFDLNSRPHRGLLPQHMCCCRADLSIANVSRNDDRIDSGSESLSYIKIVTFCGAPRAIPSMMVYVLDDVIMACGCPQGAWFTAGEPYYPWFTDILSLYLIIFYI
jgi:hypothetical protein